MRIDIITVQPPLLESPLGHSIIRRAQEKGLAQIVIHNLRDYAINKHGQVDDYQFGGGAGMVLMCEPIATLMDKLLAERTYDEVIYTAPDGEIFDQPMANSLSLKKNLIILCGHYKGIDERIREYYITKEISIGNFVLTGGELPAAIISDCIIRLLPGVLGNEESALFDSFQDNLLAPPAYTRPSDFRGMKVPEVLLSGNFRLIEEWRMEQAIEKTNQKRPEMNSGEN
ncbi:MAG: tRNA (guanosine(37)-N1)-methyltransferase TrmD [Bacteroidia bacterium]|nr:tRNA (guanosine(37)-N1)-methyltransferase TrmD [Bacteroidia bacterium]